MIILTFSNPQYLSLLVLIPIIVLLHFFLLRMKRSDAVRFANFDAIARIRGVDLYSKNIVIVGLTGMATILIIFSLSGFSLQQDVSTSAHSYVIAVDSSQSMEAADIMPSRIGAAKNTAIDFVDSTPIGTRIAVLSFSGNSFIEQELTQDKSLAKNGINSIELSAIGGTDPSEAIVSSTNILASEKGKAIILMSDGRLNVGGIDTAVEYARDNNVIIHTIGLGTIEGGQTRFGVSTLEEESLKSVAFSTGGKYFRAGSEAEMQKAFNDLLEFRMERVSINLSRQLLSVTLILILIQYVLINTRFRVIP